jgi:hypothetical protein
LQPGLSGNPFLEGKSAGKKDWERKTEKAAQKIKINQQHTINNN